MQLLKKGFQLLKNMGGRYLAFRLSHEFQVRSGLLKRKFPVDPVPQRFSSLEEWRKLPASFFFDERIQLKGDVPAELANDCQRLREGKLRFFSSTEYSLGREYDWLTNPDTGYTYPANVHWTQINDYSKEAGDIKYVWEKSRFSFLYTIIRYDAYTGEDHAGWVLEEILSWIRANPINCGPNYKCSQEISLRVLNWTFALNFYKKSQVLTEEIFQEIMHAIYWQMQHVYHNINFSRIAVRNNHAISETLALYLAGLLYPFFPEAKRWKKQGKKWFEEEIAYQIYEDGTFLQFSLNYQRVVVQLLTWALRLSEINQERFQDIVYERAYKCLDFLLQCMDETSGWLPNYGANDGTLLFPLNKSQFRDYRPQLEALCRTLGYAWKYESFEDAAWYGLGESAKEKEGVGIRLGVHRFDKGGFYLFRTEDSLSFIRCGNHKDRPSQADNLHLDVWHKGRNVLHDAGSYKYSTTKEDLRYFMGTASHNTVMLDSHDQMLKGVRFIWYHWTQCDEVEIGETQDYFTFSGTIRAFRQLDSSIRHKRILKIYKKEAVWEVEDSILNKPASVCLQQRWHTSFPELLNFEAKLETEESLKAGSNDGFVSNLYGKKESCMELIFSTREERIYTKIKLAE